VLQVQASATDAGYLVTHSEGNGDGDFFYSTISAATLEDTTATPLGTVCNDQLSWAATADDEVHAFARQTSCSDASTWDLGFYSETSMMLDEPEDVSGRNAAPTIAATVADGFVFANCAEMVHVDRTGIVLDEATLPGGACDIATAGTALRRIVSTGTELIWSELTTDGQLTEILRFDAEAVMTPAIAYDGSGWVVVWEETGTQSLMFAHICVPD
jgi:hypothetical protein